MISVSKLLCGLDAEGDGLRYDAAEESEKPQVTEEKQRRPVVVWNTTKQCNLYCEHCYAGADDGCASGELSTGEGERLLEDLADFDVPVVLFSGGEPLARPDLEHLVAYASDLGVRPVLSTNGTLVTEERAAALRDAGLKYAGVSVDGTREVNDAFRGRDGAFDAAIRGIHCFEDAGVKTGLRYTITRRTAPVLEDVVALLHDESVDRFCFYHLDYGGRGVADADLEPDEKRDAVRRVCDLTRQYHADGAEIETLLVGNYADAAFLVEYARDELGDAHASTVREYLRRNGGDPAGDRVADVDYRGNVHLTQFWQDYSLGNVRDRAFGDVWADDTNPLLDALRDREPHLPERCQRCDYLDVCQGGSRLRALAATGDVWGDDPQCYLTDGELGIHDPHGGAANAD